MKTMKNCHALYLKCDVLLLADVFEKVRNNSLKKYVSYISKRYSQAQKTHSRSYNPKQESKHIFRQRKFIWLCNVYISSKKGIQMDRS